MLNKYFSSLLFPYPLPQRRSHCLPPYDPYFPCYLFYIVSSSLSIYLFLLPYFPPNPSLFIDTSSTSFHIPTSYFISSQPFLRPLIFYVITPILILIILLTFIIGHINVQDPIAANAPPSNKLLIEDVQGSLMCDDNFCRVCQVFVTPLSRHCRKCNLCVYRFDHHCQFLNCCIGQPNYRPFFILITLGSINLFIATWLAIHLTILFSLHPYLVLYFPSSSCVDIDTCQLFGYNIAIISGILSIYYFIPALLITYLWSFHIRLALSGGITTFQWLTRKRDQQLALERTKQLPEWAQLPSPNTSPLNSWVTPNTDIPLHQVHSHTSFIDSTTNTD